MCTITTWSWSSVLAVSSTRSTLAAWPCTVLPMTTMDWSGASPRGAAAITLGSSRSMNEIWSHASHSPSKMRVHSVSNAGTHRDRTNAMGVATLGTRPRRTSKCIVVVGSFVSGKTSRT
jgi:hypothetical protein